MIRAWLTRLRRRLRPDPIRIELDVVEQIILNHLLRYDRGPALDLLQEVQALRPTATEQQVRLSLIRLESLGLIARDASPQLEVDNRGRAYTITRDGRRLKAVLQETPTARIQTYL